MTERDGIDPETMRAIKATWAMIEAREARDAEQSTPEAEPTASRSEEEDRQRLQTIFPNLTREQIQYLMEQEIRQYLHKQYETAAHLVEVDDLQRQVADAFDAERVALEAAEAFKKQAALAAEQIAAAPELSTRQQRRLLHARVLERFNRAHGQNDKIRLEDICTEMGDSYEAVRKYRSRKGKGKNRK
jgi:hypothetical protein